MRAYRGWVGRLVGASAGLAALAVVSVAPAGAAPIPAARVGQPGDLAPIVTAAGLPALDGSPAGTVPVPLDVNDRGDVVGESFGRPVVWRGGRPVELPAGGGWAAYATHVNDRGDVVVDIADGGAYRWRDGEVTSIETGWPDSRPLFLNEQGEVVLTQPSSGGRLNGVWQDGAFTAIPPPDGRYLVMTGLSDAGHVTGDGAGAVPTLTPIVPWLWHDGAHTLLAWLGTTRAVNRAGHVVGIAPSAGGVLWRDGLTIPLGLVPTDINERGQVVGVREADDGLHGVRWDEGVLTDLGVVGSSTITVPAGPMTMDEQGRAAGTRVANGQIRYTLWASGHTVDLGLAHPDAAQTGITVKPLAMNDRGQVVGSLHGENGEPGRAVMWSIEDDGDPVEPDDGCILANNWAHARDGRATSFLVHAWAAGSGQYLGPVTDTTALREARPGTWELVDAC